MPHNSKLEILHSIAESAIDGNLGLLIGSGFSKAVINPSNVALSWDELLIKAANIYGIDAKNIYMITHLMYMALMLQNI